MRSEWNIIRRDWSEYRRLIFILTGGVCLTLLLADKSRDFARGAIGGLLLGSSYGFAQFCFIAERQRRTLDLLLSLPIRPFRLILAKYGSVYSMTLFLVNAPGIFLGDLHLLFAINAAAVVLSTLCLAPSVLSDKPWAPQVPLWLVVLLMIPAQRVIHRFQPESANLIVRLLPHFGLIAATALCGCVFTVFVTAAIFEKKIH